MVHLITYDLHQPRRDYPKIEAVIARNADSWRHPQGSVWLVDGPLSPEQWFELLYPAGDADDEVLILRLSGGWWSNNLDPSTATWLRDPARRW
jgi:hypothetical protein